MLTMHWILDGNGQLLAAWDTRADGYTTSRGNSPKSIMSRHTTALPIAGLKSGGSRNRPHTRKAA
jgi:hypothetical protein